MNFTVLISAYSINPYKALDDGIAWNIVRALDQKFRLIIVTHPGNRSDIEHFLARLPDGDGMQARFEYYAPSFWLTNKNHHPPKTILHTYTWHWGVVSFIRQRHLQFDLSHHLSFPCAWCPSFLWQLGKPFIWGPAGYPPKVPRDFIHSYSRWTQLKDRLCWMVKKTLWRLDPFVAITVKKAAHIFAINPKVVTELNLSGERTTVQSTFTTHSVQKKPHPYSNFKIFSAGVFEPSSGFDLAIRAFAHFYRQLNQTRNAPTVELVLVGKGAARRKLESIATDMKLPAGTIQIIESEDPVVIEQHLSESKIFFSTSHESMDRLVPLALAHRLPVVCFDHAETGRLIEESNGRKTSYRTYQETTREFAGYLFELHQDPELLQELSVGARKKFETHLTWAARGDFFAAVYWNVFHRSILFNLLEKDVT